MNINYILHSYTVRLIIKWGGGKIIDNTSSLGNYLLNKGIFVTNNISSY